MGTTTTFSWPGSGAVRPPGRIVAVDAARGLALIGMIAVHLFSETGPDDAASPVQSVLAGRAAPLFAVLAGAAVAFTTGRARVVGARPARVAAARLGTRAVLVCLLGLALGSFDTDRSPGVILVFYGVLFALAVPLVLLPTRAVLAAGVVAACVMPVISHLARAHLPAPLGTDPSFVSVVTDPVTALREVTLTGNYPVATWFAYVCVGLVVGRLDLSSRRVALRLVVVGTAVAIAAYWVSWVLLHPLGGLSRLLTLPADTDDPVSELLSVGAGGVVPTDSWWWLAVLSPHSGTTPQVAQSAGIAVAVVGVLCLATGLPGGTGRAVDVVLSPLVATGSMTLTLYCVHVVYLISPYSRKDSVPAFVAEIAAYAVFALAWGSRFRRGPLEGLVGRAVGRAGALAAGRPPAERRAGDGVARAR
ncbi:heparan-alpha-glucosaminide N-acetyltransferase domain-containing protein [Pseudonocardia spirodelae]|uniref:Heparan-alpha-glucosaminide N-acetyltransferase domain-containing protein n=1 Tax=Pseudonocardia spirodelae TaxID=3133431 RepID=A0ABU8T9C4_9PSEU